MKILTLCSLLSLFPLYKGVSAQALKTSAESPSKTTTSNGVIIHEAQGVEKVEKAESKGPVTNVSEKKYTSEQLISMMNDCKQKMDAVSDPKDKERYANEIMDLEKKMALLEDEKEK